MVAGFAVAQAPFSPIIPTADLMQRVKLQIGELVLLNVALANDLDAARARIVELERRLVDAKAGAPSPPQ